MAPPHEVEARVRRLVTMLNRYPAVHTFSSCGGHADPTPEQAGEQEFYVAFVVERTRVAWNSLERIVFAVESARDVFVRAWCSGDDPQCLAFELRGVRQCDPDAIADALRFDLDCNGATVPRRPGYSGPSSTV
jgi:hypothetical protein